jgi:hypothetical protein
MTYSVPQPQPPVPTPLYSVPQPTLAQLVKKLKEVLIQEANASTRGYSSSSKLGMVVKDEHLPQTIQKRNELIQAYPNEEARVMGWWQSHFRFRKYDILSDYTKWLQVVNSL